MPASPLEGGRFRRAVTGARNSAFEGVMMARHSKTKNNTPRAAAGGSPARPGSSSPTIRRSSKIANVAKTLRRILSTVLVLAVLAVVGVVSVALIQGTWQ